ncbi:MAG TPA: IS30 family transposase [Gemmatimonadaceae bacterium]|nr:IS30 family transposase [Gemmatimonadaceae bacterium]
MAVALLNEMWARHRAGESITAIAKALGRPYDSIYWLIADRGGVAPLARRRAAQALTSDEREVISRGLAAGESCRAIATVLQRAPSTISREIRRNAGPTKYRANRAERRAWHQAQRPKPCRLAQHRGLRVAVSRKLAAAWSPQQISGWLMTAYPDDPQMHVSHETIYRTLYLQTRGALKRELTAHLRTFRPIRRSKKRARDGQKVGQIAGAISIAERPASVEDRAIPGHWEGDLIQGRHFTYIATLVERWSRYVHLVRVTSKETEVVTSALIREVQRLPAGLMATLTWDRGHEMAQHARFTVATDVTVYFCDPRSPWQRGANENTNGLLRQYFPKGADLSRYSQRQLDAVARQLNTRPRKTLGYKTPAAMLAEAVATTG